MNAQKSPVHPNGMRTEEVGALKTNEVAQNDSAQPQPLRYAVDEARAILRMSRAQLYNRIAEGSIRAHKDGARTYVSYQELRRYVVACEERAARVCSHRR